ncbi:glycosyltransferase [Mameliella alba]|uniref:Glycosyl transferase, group 1 n=1 Tax=Mameliella alba TaxID=561184 RepID=A0A0B3RG10_9RHOB|nr:glycosyltransferase [Mameliella alba]KHQ50160.1 Glycosyl transferase, group 1 [Mameliella alba]
MRSSGGADTVFDAGRSLLCRHIVASVDDEASGPTYSVTALAAGLQVHHVDCAVMAVGRRRPEPGLEIFAQDLTRLPVVNRFVISGALSRALDTAGKQGAVLHSHGLWLMPNIYPARAARRHGVPLVVSPRGMLGPEALAFSRNRKRVIWALGQRRALETAACFHATAWSEVEDIRRAGLAAPVAVIPNGIDIPEGTAETSARTVLHLGRLHPKKGIDRLVAAWARVAERHPDWRLRIVGPSEIGCREALERQVHDLGAPRVDFDGPLFGSEKRAAYRQAGLFVLPTLNENFGMVVAEALATGIPAISTKGAPWQGLETERCGWWVDHGPEPLAAALDAALALPDAERALMGARGRDWMRRDFGWDGIAARMAQVYAWCLGQGERPDCVVTV